MRSRSAGSSASAAAPASGAAGEAADGAADDGGTSGVSSLSGRVGRSVGAGITVSSSWEAPLGGLRPLLGYAGGGVERAGSPTGGTGRELASVLAASQSRAGAPPPPRPWPSGSREAPGGPAQGAEFPAAPRDAHVGRQAVAELQPATD